MAVLTPASVYRRYDTDGVPDSGPHEPKKDEIVQLLNSLFGTSRGGWVVAQTLVELNTITPENETDGGVVLTGTGSGYYDRNEGLWVFGRGFPDTFARVVLSGTGSAQAGEVSAGVNPAATEVYYARVITPNIGALTLSISGEPAKPVVNLAGNPLSPGEWAGIVMFYLNDEGDYQLLIDAGAAASAAASASLASQEADRAEASADIAWNNWAGDEFVGDGTSDPLPLSLAPGSINNCRIYIEGEGPQPPTIFSLNGNMVSPPAGAAWPMGKAIVILYGSVIAINEPADGSVTANKIGGNAVGADAVNAGEAGEIKDKLGLGEEDTPAFAGLTIGGLPVTPGGVPVSFSAHKNGTGQSGITSATFVKVTFGTEEWDEGSHYDAAASRFTPPAGRYRLSAAVYWSIGLVSGQQRMIFIYKNGSLHKGAYDSQSVTSGISSSVECVVDANGTDYFEVYVRANGSGEKALSGDDYLNYFQGESI